MVFLCVRTSAVIFILLQSVPIPYSSADTKVTRHIKIYDVRFNDPKVLETPEVSVPSFFKTRFHVNNGVQELRLTRNSGIRPESADCIIQSGKCKPTKQVLSFYQDLNNGAAFQITCSDKICKEFSLRGTFISKNSMYFMEPLKKSHKYKIKKLSGANHPKTDYFESDDVKFVPRRGRHKRAAGIFEVELLVVTDSSVFEYWRNFLGSGAGDAEVENFIRTVAAFTVNGMDVRYGSINTESYQIRIVYVGIYMAKTSSDSPWSSTLQANGRLDADQVLQAFSQWITTNRDKLPKHDHAMAFTQYNIIKGMGSLDNDIAGYAYQGQICQDKSQSVVEENLNFIMHTVAAHELGHSLGARHDGFENTCSRQSHFIMEATSSAVGGSKARHPWLFSSCSKQEMGNLLSSIDATASNCLKRVDHTGTVPNLADFVNLKIGQQISIHEQCIHAMGNSQSYACLDNFNGDFSTVCTGLWCFNPNTGNSCNLVVPLDYTTCGSGKWCNQGECKADNSAPKEPENCLYGNYYGANCTGIASNPAVCYAGYAVRCCHSCNAVSTGDPGCEYGDRQQACTSITNGAPCYSSNTEVQCCATCAAYKTKIQSCKYGDQRNCSALTFPGDCYGSFSDGSAARNVCCETCHNYETGIQDCLYGDRVLDCRSNECATYENAGVLKDCCETCKFYVVSTPAPAKNSTALPTWVIPVAAGGGGGLLLIIVIIVACCCCRKSPSEKAALKYQQQMPKSNVPRQQNRLHQPDPRYKSEIRQPQRTEYMGPIRPGEDYTQHAYESPLPSVQHQTSTGPSRQMSTKSHIYMELEPDPNITVNSGYVVSSKDFLSLSFEMASGETMAESTKDSPEVTPAVRHLEVVDSGDDPLSRQTVPTPPQELSSPSPSIVPDFNAMYLGSAVLDRRYPPQFVMPWVMAEVKRRKSAFQEVTLKVKEHVLHAKKFNTEAVMFEHKLTCMTRFAKTHQDPRCFAYLSRQNLYCDYECHVFLAHDEGMVPELFSSIQEATRRDLFVDMGESKMNEPAKAFYEVLYLGKAKLNTKKINCDQVDRMCNRLEKQKQDRKQKQRETEMERKRHGSGVSVKSLPTNLETAVTVTENELEKQILSSGPQVESPSNSTDEFSSTENVLENSSGSLANSFGLYYSDNSKEDLSECSNAGGTGEGNTKDQRVQFSEPLDSASDISSEPNRAMLFRLGGSEISLISLDKKHTILEKKFKDIASVSQGKEKSDTFGFIAREKGNVFVCYLMKCHSFSIVDEIMMVLRSAFRSAYEQRQQICIMCPLHQLHRLCQEINGLDPQEAHKRLMECVNNLQEKDSAPIHTVLKAENPQSYEEIVEVLMIELRKLCEAKQQDHSHISDPNKPHFKQEFSLFENRRSSVGAAALNFKKSLTSSFENFMAKVPHKKPNETIERFRHRSGTAESGQRKPNEARERFRHRSGTTESESSFSKSMDSSLCSTPEASPMPSPAAVKEVHFSFPSPPSSPKSRPRSSTEGAVPDPDRVSKLTNITNLDRASDFREQSGRRASMNSPMKQMFLLTEGGGSPGSLSKRRQSASPSLQSGNGETPVSGRRGSWRQTIFNRVVTPARAADKPPTVLEKSETESPKAEKTRSPEELRALWKKAIQQTVLLLKIEKEKQDIKKVFVLWGKKSLKVFPGKAINPLGMMGNSVMHESCVQQGVPKTHRGDIWWLLTEQHKLQFPEIENQTPQKSYTELLKDLTEYMHNILIDLGRTFPGHPYFATQLGPGQLALYNLLKAYSLLDKEVGYCQGLSFIAGILLMHMEEEHAFETLRHMMFNLGLRRQFQPNMMPLQVQLYQLTRLIFDNYKDLHDHFEEHEIAPNLYAAPWFLTLFASQFPLGFVARVFDLLLVQGVEILLKVALVLLGNHKELILQCDSFESIVEFIKTTLPEMGVIQMERVINQVFELDISKQLQAYEVEYHVLREEMLFSPQRGDTDLNHKLEDANRNLKQQNMELLEKIQHIHSHHRSLEITIHNLQTNESKLKSHIKTLELERKALLNAVTKLRSLIPDDEYLKLDISLPPLSPSLSSSPIHQPNSTSNSIRGAIKKVVGKSLSSPLSELGSKQFQFE
ncbi:TBC1 domain family member 4-like [Saccostrea cucullata]|uniref:TBC1 domain family member 4-like n=1 Tax=Saccostrea cuccullata TaxID=36930 RepID=UPI002ED64D6D